MTSPSLGVYQALGTTFELRAAGRLGRLLGASYADLLVDEDVKVEHVVEISRRFPGRWDVLCDEAPRIEGCDAPTALYGVMTLVNELAANSAVGTDTLLHGGSVEIDGVAVAFVGPSGSGKTTLTAHAALSGHPYIADEAVAVDPTGRVRPFHRPVGLRPGGAERLGITIPRGPYRYSYPLRLGDRAVLSSGAPLGLIALVTRQPGSTTVQPLDPPKALMRLANETLGTRGHERTMFRRLDALVRQVPVIEVMFDDVAIALRSIVDTVDRSRAR